MKIITIEGIDGTGKGVQTKKLKEALIAKGHRVGELDFPCYNSFFGGITGGYLSGRNGVRADTVDQHSMALWFALDRWEAMSKLDKDAFDVLLLNRYVLSNAVYQSIRPIDIGKTELLDFCMELEYGHFHLPRPDLQFILDVDPLIAAKNVEKKGFREYIGNQKDVYEEQKGMQQRARDMYLKYAARLPEAIVIPCMHDGRLLPIETVHTLIMEQLEAFL